MGIVSESIFYDLIALAVSVLVGVVLYAKWRLTYWDRVGLTTLSPCIPFGDTKDLLLGRKTFGEEFQKFYRAFKDRGIKHGGIYFGIQPFYIPTDPEIIKHIMQNDFQHFINHTNYIDEEIDPLTGHLFALQDAKWRNMRIKLTPTFTSGKMKMMFQTLSDCTVGLKDIMNDAVSKKAPVDIKEILGRFTTDIIGSAAFGIECNSLKDPDAEFRKYGKRVFELESWTERINIMLQFVLPTFLLRAIRYRTTKKEVEKFFMKAVRDTVDYREKNNVYRKDFMHLLLQLKNRGKVSDDDKVTDGKTEEKALTMNELSAQCFVFFLAGFETSSTLMTFALYELAINPDVQEKLREEIRTVLKKHDQKVTYDGMMEMTYMEKVLNETLRKYPPVPFLSRRCNLDYTIPNTNIVLRKGDSVAISSFGLHRDPEYYPNPEKFDPERFSEENKNSRPAFTWLPFGEGPRVCIGLRFGMLQSKVGITTLLNNYKITLSSKTIQPLVFDRKVFITTAKGGIWLDVQKIN